MCWLSNQKIGHFFLYHRHPISISVFCVIFPPSIYFFTILYISSVFCIYSLLPLSTHSLLSPLLYLISCGVFYFCILKSVLHLISFFFFFLLYSTISSPKSYFYFCILYFKISGPTSRFFSSSIFDIFSSTLSNSISISSSK